MKVQIRLPIQFDLDTRGGRRQLMDLAQQQGINLSASFRMKCERDGTHDKIVTIEQTSGRPLEDQDWRVSGENIPDDQPYWRVNRGTPADQLKMPRNMMEAYERETYVRGLEEQERRMIKRATEKADKAKPKPEPPRKKRMIVLP